jgi:hypothetical protein
MRHARWIIVPLIVVALAAHAPVAAARKPKETLSAVVNGRRVKFGRKLISSSGSATSGIIAIGGAQKAHFGRTARVLGVGCAIALSGATFPADGMFCTMNYTEVKLSRSGLTTKGWTAVEGVQVTVESFDGTRVAGTFNGTLQPPAGASYGPATVTSGIFNVPLNQTP